MEYGPDRWMDGLQYMEDYTTQGGFDNVSEEELRWLYGRVAAEFRARKRAAESGNVHIGWNEGWA